MRPTSLAIRGLKCWDDRTFELGPLTAIQGPNGTGKTAIIQAIRLAQLGYDPEAGKQLEKTRKLIAPDAEKETAEIGLSFDTGFGIRRRFGAKTEIQVFPSRGEKGVAACQARINKETGGLVVSLDIGTFYDLSAEKRRAWLFEHLPTGSAELTWDTFAKWTDAPLDGEGGLASVIRDLWEHNVQTAPNAVTGLGSAIETAHREFLESYKSRQNQGKVVERGAELLRTEEAPEAVDEEELQDLEERLASTNQRIGETRAGREAREAINGRIGVAKLKGSRLLGEIEHTKGVRRDLLAQLQAMAAPDASDRGAELAEFEAELERLQLAHHEAHDAMTRTGGAVNRLAAQKSRVEEYGPCPYALLGCEQDTEGMRGHVLTRLGQEFLEAQDLADAAAATESKIRQDREIAQEAAARIRIEIRDADDLGRRRVDLERAAESKAVVLCELEERAEIHAGLAETAKAELAALGSDEALAGIYEVRDALQASRIALQDRVEARVRHSERVAAHGREEAVLEVRSKRTTALKELDGNLRRLRGHVIQAMVEPLEQEAGKILAAMDPAKRFRFYFERGNAATLELGFQEDGVIRLEDAASGGELVMLTVAFLGALLSVIKPPMRLLVIDNAEKLDDVRRRRLMVGLVELRDRFDMVLIAGACQLEGVPGWDLVDLGPVNSGVPAT